MLSLHLIVTCSAYTLFVVSHTLFMQGLETCQDTCVKYSLLQLFFKLPEATFSAEYVLHNHKHQIVIHTLRYVKLS